MPLVVLPVTLAAILAATLQPVVGALVGRGRPRPMAAAVVVGGGFLAITVVLALTFAVLVGQVTEIAVTAASGADTADAALGGLADLLTGAVTELGGGAVSTIPTLAGAPRRPR